MCPDCEQLRKDLNDKLAAMRAYVFGVSPGGRQMPRCICGLFATNSVKASHPVGGMNTFLLCDYCEPPRQSFDDRTVYTCEDLNEDSPWARQANYNLIG